MKASSIKKIIHDNSEDIAFILGNGINRYYNRNNISWKNLLLELWETLTEEKLERIPKGISYTEFFDTLELENFKKDGGIHKLQKAIATRMIDWTPNAEQNLILNKIQALNTPLLTTNYDALIANSLDLEFKKIKGQRFTDFYPWSTYYSNQVLEDPAVGFGLWHINGMIKYPRSIKLGLSQYMGNVSRAHQLFFKKPKNLFFGTRSRSDWVGAHTWLQILMQKRLFIFGLGLEENEIFLRWLLLQRAKYFIKYPEKFCGGWFLTTKSSKDPNFSGMDFFFQRVGIKLIPVESYKVIYEDIWK